MLSFSIGLSGYEQFDGLETCYFTSN